MSSSSQSESSTPSPGSASGDAEQGGISTRWLVLGVIMLAVVPLVWQEVPNEISRWYDAAADEYLVTGDPQSARASLQQALAWNPNNADALLRRAEMYRQAGDYDAGLQDCEQVLGTRPALFAALAAKSEFQHLLGQPEKATAIWKELLDGAPQNPVLLNALAYGQAVGDIELDEGLQHTEQAIRELGGFEQMLVAFGNLHYVCGERKRAFDLIDTAFAIAAAEKRRLSAELHDGQTYQQQHPIKRRLAAIEAFITQTEEHTARLLRSASDDQGKRSAGIQQWFGQVMDEAQLTVNGFEPNLVMSNANLYASHLDTRGFLHYRRGDLGAALSDLDLAVSQMELVYEVRRQANEEQASKQAQVIFAEELDAMRHALAVMLYHRSLVLQQLHRDEEAEADLERVRKLGEVPGDTLF
ncbi:MAG TPA: hypothetical protein DCY79_18815 [Planctomycetaceae bacterium]|nr:hypothetical protein [Planctomycetaceae bacterium]